MGLPDAPSPFGGQNEELTIAAMAGERTQDLQVALKDGLAVRMFSWGQKVLNFVGFLLFWMVNMATDLLTTHGDIMCYQLKCAFSMHFAMSFGFTVSPQPLVGKGPAPKPRLGGGA